MNGLKHNTPLSKDLSLETNKFFDNLPEQEKIKIAVVLPVYNTESYLRECLDALQKQTHDNFIVFAVDDGSVDRSGIILDEYAKRDPRFWVFHKENGGVSSARNFALEQIERDGSFHLVAFCDSDDVVAPDFLRFYAYGVATFQAQFVMIGYVSFDREGVVRKRRESHPPIQLSGDEILKFCFGLHPKSGTSPAMAYFLNNVSFCSYLIQGLRFQEDRSIGEDADFRFRALLRSKNGVVLSDEGYNYRIRKSSLSNSISLLFLFSQLELYIDWLERRDQIPIEFVGSIRRLAFKQFRQALIWAYENNELDQAWEKFSEYHEKIRSGGFIPCSASGVFLLFMCGPRAIKCYLSFRRKGKCSHQRKHKERMFAAFD